VYMCMCIYMYICVCVCVYIYMCVCMCVCMCNLRKIHFGDVYGTRGWFYEFLIKRLLKHTFRLPKNGDYYKGYVHIEDAVGSMMS